MEASLAEPAKLTRFAAATKTDAAAARASLTETLGWFQSYTAVNHPKTQEGYGRLDAVGRIINRTIRFTSGSVAVACSRVNLRLGREGRTRGGTND